MDAETLGVLLILAGVAVGATVALWWLDRGNRPNEGQGE